MLLSKFLTLEGTIKMSYTLLNLKALIQDSSKYYCVLLCCCCCTTTFTILLLLLLLRLRLWCIVCIHRVQLKQLQYVAGEVCYVVLHNGCLYVYKDEKSPKPDKAMSLFGYTQSVLATAAVYCVVLLFCLFITACTLMLVLHLLQTILTWNMIEVFVSLVDTKLWRVNFF